MRVAGVPVRCPCHFLVAVVVSMFSHVIESCNGNMSEIVGSSSLVHPPRILQDKEQMIREGKGIPWSVMSRPDLESGGTFAPQAQIYPPAILSVIIQPSGAKHFPN